MAFHHALFMMTSELLSRSIESKSHNRKRITYSDLTPPPRRADRLLNTCHNKGQEERPRQEAAVRAREPGPAAICFYRVFVTVEGRWVKKGGFIVLTILFVKHTVRLAGLLVISADLHYCGSLIHCVVWLSWFHLHAS